MKRILLMVAYNILLVPFMWFKLCYYARHVEKYTEEERYKMLRFIGPARIKGGRIVIDISWTGQYSERGRLYAFPESPGTV